MPNQAETELQEYAAAAQESSERNETHTLTPVSLIVVSILALFIIGGFFALLCSWFDKKAKEGHWDR